MLALGPLLEAEQASALLLMGFTTHAGGLALGQPLC